MLKQVSVFGLFVVAIAGLSAPVRSQHQLAVPPMVEADPYEEKAVAAEMTTSRAVIVYTEENAPATPKLEDLLLKQNVSQYGITWSFQKPTRVGQFVNGDWYVVGPVTIEAIDPNPLYGSEIPKRELASSPKLTLVNDRLILASSSISDPISALPPEK